MSSTVGFGVEVTGEIYNQPVNMGDFEQDVYNKFPFLTVVRSRAEYGDEEKVFIFIGSTIVTAGDNETSAEINFTTPEKEDIQTLQRFLAEAGAIYSKFGWYLVDYYVYS